MVSRRQFLKSSTALGAAALAAPTALFPKKVLAQAIPALLDPFMVPQFVNALPLPGKHTTTAFQVINLGAGDIPVPKYTLTITETKASFGLGLPGTTAWGYNGKVPADSFDLVTGQPIVVEYVNGLVDVNGIPITHYLPLDDSIDWANPDPTLSILAPVPLVAHLHGQDSANDPTVPNPVPLSTRQYLSDGNPDAWGTPDNVEPGKPVYEGRLFSFPYVYENGQEAGHLWYHDHTLGITRQNVYMGLAGNYFLRDANELALRTTNVIPSEAL